MSFTERFGRGIRNAFRQWAAGMNSGEYYDRSGQVTGVHHAGYKYEDKDGNLHEVPAKDFVVTRTIGHRALVLKEGPVPASAKPTSSTPKPP